ncbi:hypothetical protein BS50DRAFT_670645 [Corynespora cassiicola Philippines]|uniref:Glyoxalase-like domain-containing protein n=1 Tax=Corynespora cassiicola Philippines TaxID=1448308 RepID=A0A2T2P976_CORCC|nr:hypothetical protein BS50DRAFT_670645 [Corynespora cassiicola Philippines]
MTSSTHSLGYEIRGVTHPTAVISERKIAVDMFMKVFNISGFSQESVMTPERTPVGYPNNYSWLFPIADVLFDVIEPALYTPVGWTAPPVKHQDGLVEIGMNINGTNALHTQALVPRGIRTIDGLRRPVSKDEAADCLASMHPKTDAWSGKLIWSLPEDTGLSWEFIGSPNMAPPFDEIVWSGEPSPNDPLGIEHGSHHTLVTRDLDRALKVPLGVFPGQIIHKGYNPLLQTDSTYIWLPAKQPPSGHVVSPLLLEVAVPTTDDSVAAKELAKGPKPSLLGLPSKDSYYMLTWKVKDLDKAKEHLKNVGIGFEATSETTIITNPEDFCGIRWGFTSEFVPGDPRRH